MERESGGAVRTCGEFYNLIDRMTDESQLDDRRRMGPGMVGPAAARQISGFSSLAVRDFLAKRCSKLPQSNKVFLFLR